MLQRALAGLLAASLVAAVARRAGTLTTSGGVAAAMVGSMAVAAGWAWGALLLVYFVLTVTLSGIGAATKERRTAGIVAKGGRRDHMQVVANGGAFAVLALASAAGGPAALSIAAAGALAAATADSWATEIGTLASAAPRSMRTLQRVPPGTSGGMSIAGTLAMLAGAALIAGAASLLHLTRATLAVAAGGVAGALADSLLGATAQARRWCDACDRATERPVHGCGHATRHAGGVAWLDNDAVNLAATLVGATTAAAIGFARP